MQEKIGFSSRLATGDRARLLRCESLSPIQPAKLSLSRQPSWPPRPSLPAPHATRLQSSSGHNRRDVDIDDAHLSRRYRHGARFGGRLGGARAVCGLIRPVRPQLFTRPAKIDPGATHGN